MPEIIVNEKVIDEATEVPFIPFRKRNNKPKKVVAEAKRTDNRYRNRRCGNNQRPNASEAEAVVAAEYIPAPVPEHNPWTMGITPYNDFVTPLLSPVLMTSPLNQSPITFQLTPPQCNMKKKFLGTTKNVKSPCEIGNAREATWPVLSKRRSPKNKNRRHTKNTQNQQAHTDIARVVFGLNEKKSYVDEGHSDVYKNETLNAAHIDEHASMKPAHKEHQNCLLKKAINQIEFYFSFENLIKDEYLRNRMDNDSKVPITVIAKFKKIAILNLSPSELFLTASNLRNATLVVESGICYKTFTFPLFHSSASQEERKSENDNHIHNVTLDDKNSIKMFWQINYSADIVSFEIHATEIPPRPWLAVGFSERGLLEGADLCVFWVDWMGKVHFENAYVEEDGRLRVFSDDECNSFKFRHWNGFLKFTFQRTFNTCQPDHYVIERGTTHIVWSAGRGPLYRLDGVIAQGDENGMLRIQLLKPPLIPIEMEDAEILVLHSSKVNVPAEETTYWCSVQKLPEQFSKKYHLLEYESSIEAGNEDIVHHMELFHCEYPPEIEVPLYQGPCHTDDSPEEINACKRVIAAWAMGATTFSCPSEAGIQIGGEQYNPYVMLETHFNNPHLNEGRVDSSGFRLVYSSTLRKFDAGIMELGLEYSDKMAIPPGIESFLLAGYCIPECTALGLPPGGIYVFGSQLHTHLTGRVTWTKHLRRDMELPELNRDNHYSTHFQEIRKLPEEVNVLPGDALIMGCEYSTMDRENATLGGFSISDEMCVNYIHYYPKIDLEVCKSSVDTKTLVDYFEFMKRMELQATNVEEEWNNNYHAIEWTPLRSAFLQDFYDRAPLSMQCNRSSGDRFPGYWENKPIPRTSHPLKVQHNKCKKGKEDPEK